jgi:hypothetical protein
LFFNIFFVLDHILKYEASFIEGERPLRHYTMRLGDFAKDENKENKRRKIKVERVEFEKTFENISEYFLMTERDDYFYCRGCEKNFPLQTNRTFLMHLIRCYGKEVCCPHENCRDMNIAMVTIKPNMRSGYQNHFDTKRIPRAEHVGNVETKIEENIQRWKESLKGKK